MKIKLGSGVFKVRKLRSRNHFCTSCIAHKTVNLCNELQAHYWRKKGCSCVDDRVVFNKVADVEPLPVVKQKEISDRTLHYLLSQFIKYLDEILDHILTGGKMNKKQIEILKSYIRKINKILNGDK